MKCEKCRTEVPDGANFCHECGASFMPEVVRKEEAENKATKDQIILTLENGKLTPESEILVGTLFHPDGEIVKTMDKATLGHFWLWTYEAIIEQRFAHEIYPLTILPERTYKITENSPYKLEVERLLRAQKMVDETSGQEDQAA